MEEMNLRGRIVGMYNSVKNFSQVMQWSTRKTYDIVNGKQEPTCKEIEAMCAALHVQIPAEMRALFFN